MRRFLLIHFSSQQQVNWAVFDPQGHILESATQVSLESVPHHNYFTWVLVPGTECLLTCTYVPSRHRQKIIQAVPYALEEFLAEEIEKIHFSLGQRNPHSGLISVAVMARDLLDGYLQRLSCLKIVPQFIMPDILAIPKPSDGWGIGLTEHRFLVRTGEESGFAIESTHLKQIWEKVLQEEGPPKHLLISRSHQSLPLHDLELEQCSLKENVYEHGELAWLVQGILGRHHSLKLNLLQGHYRPIPKTAHLLRPWRLTWVLLILWGGFSLGQQGVYYQRLKQQHQTLEASIEKIYRETFPQARKVVNPRIQMEQHLKALRNSPDSLHRTEDFLALLVQIAPLLKTEGLELENLDYRQGIFEFQLVVSTWQILEALKNRLVKLGFTVKVQSAAHRNHQKIESRIRIQK